MLLLSVASFTVSTITLTAQDQPVFELYAPETPATELSTGPTTTLDWGESSYNFGTIKQGEKVVHVYTFTNIGDEPFVMAAAKGSCGCTVPQWPKEAIQPGETASITVEFNSKNKRGKRNQKVTITGNTNPPQTFLYLTGDVVTDEVIEAINIGPIEEEKPKLSKDCLLVYPNPTADFLKLEMNAEQYGKAATVAIFSDSGQLMAKRAIDAISGTVEFSVGHYPAGNYIANVQIEDAQPEVRCFVVTK